MKILAVIPARGGSKRLPRKNVRLLGDRPLIVWTIHSALALGAELCDVLVSTDDENIARVAAEAGAMVPWLRPPELATDTASSVDVCLHALEWYENTLNPVDALLLLQPTSPFRRAETLLSGISSFNNNPGASVLGVSAVKKDTSLRFEVVEGQMIPFDDANLSHFRSQDLSSAYELNGSFYLIKVETLRRNLSFIKGQLIPLITKDEFESIDIDTKLDWLLAEAVVNLSDAYS